jgi:hypothetical protein
VKTSKYTLAIMFALAFNTMERAQTVVIHITGSPLYRSAANLGILDILQGVEFGYTGASLNSANQAIFTGPTISGNIPVIIKTSWSCSSCLSGASNGHLRRSVPYRSAFAVAALLACTFHSAASRLPFATWSGAILGSRP